MEKHTVDITIIGAGVVGLAVALNVGGLAEHVLVVESEAGPGKGISSRNSEVIHAGLYYPQEFLKTKLCVRGNPLLYEFCERYHVPHKQIGKVVVAVNDPEKDAIESLFDAGEKNGVQGLELLERHDLKKREPHVEGGLSLYSPNTGIVDSHRLTKTLEGLSIERGAQIMYKTCLIALEKKADVFSCTVQHPDKTIYTFFSRIVINASGLFSDKIAQMPGIDIDRAGYRIFPCKGEYFRVHGGAGRHVKGLVYPSPLAHRTGLGIHATKDLAGGLRLGPNAIYVDEPDYTVDPDHSEEFYQSIRSLLPFIHKEDISPDMAGIRPKIQGPNDPIKDFVISHETDKGLSGMINLIGIESPGLTSCLAIGEKVKALIRDAQIL
jgi:L-2-hydroxyglutarate oxidase LhgO